MAAFKLLKDMPGMRDARLRCAGYLGSAPEYYFKDLKARAAAQVGWKRPMATNPPKQTK